MAVYGKSSLPKFNNALISAKTKYIFLAIGMTFHLTNSVTVYGHAIWVRKRSNYSFQSFESI